MKIDLMRTIKIKHALIIILLTLISSCSSTGISDLERTEMYNGEKVRLETANMWFFPRALFFFLDPLDVSIKKIDSTTISGWNLNPFSFNDEYAIKPGTHTLKLSCTNNAKDEYAIRGKGTLTFEAVLGKRYRVKAIEKPGLKCEFFIQEVDIAKPKNSSSTP